MAKLKEKEQGQNMRRKKLRFRVDEMDVLRGQMCYWCCIFMAFLFESGIIFDSGLSGKNCSHIDVDLFMLLGSNYQTICGAIYVMLFLFIAFVSLLYSMFEIRDV